MKKTIYRFKTKYEFIKEFGTDWRNNVPGGWHGRMDKYIGQEITNHEYITDLIEKDQFLLVDSVLNCNWYIRNAMVTTEEVEDKSSIEIDFGQTIWSWKMPKHQDISMSIEKKPEQKTKLSDKLLKKQTIKLNQNN